MTNSFGGLFYRILPAEKHITARSIDALEVETGKFSLNVSDYVHMDGPTIKRSIESICKDIARTENALKQQSKHINTLLEYVQKKA